MARTNGTLPYHCYRATNATDARIGCVPTVPESPYRCVGQFANTGGCHLIMPSKEETWSVCPLEGKYALVIFVSEGVKGLSENSALHNRQN
jgi:hypothetical protein